MRSLFLKIFVWFWLAMALVGLALIIATSMTQSDPVEKRWRYMTSTAVGIYAQTAAEMYERDGPSALGIYLRRVEQIARMRTKIFNERGEEMSGGAATIQSKRMAELAQRTRHSEETLFDFPAEPVPVALIAQRVYGPGGAAYVFISEVPRNRFAALLAEPGALLFRIGVVLMTAGLVCYGLARYLAAPVETLRAGVRRLASGDLAVRVSGSVGARRDEIADLSHDFDRMAERIESLVVSQRRLLGDISHELRSPLARLSIALGLARQRADVAAQGALDRIEREAERLNGLIGQLLTLTQLESGAQQVEKTEIDLQNLVLETAADADYEARGRHRQVQVVESAECIVMGNIELLRSALENAMRNAVRYTAENTVVEVALRCHKSDNNLRATISVRDHGKGVPEEALADLFRPFYRVADARDRQTGGTGLGLAITDRAVRLHGGTVQAANAENGGLVVEIQLPAASVK